MATADEISVAERSLLDRLLRRCEVEELYSAYATALDEWKLEAWPLLFTDPCLYRVMPRENYERGLPLCLMFCESRGMLEDRVMAVRETAVYAPRVLRHMTSGLEVREMEDGSLHAQANYVIFRSRLEAGTEIRSAGRYIDTIVREDGRLKFRERLCVLDTSVSPNTLVLPV